MARSIKISEFKARCLKLVAEVAETGEELVITKRGRAMARVVPERAGKPSTLQGAMKGLIEIRTPDKSLPTPWSGEAEEAETVRLARLAADVSPTTVAGDE